MAFSWVEMPSGQGTKALPEGFDFWGSQGQMFSMGYQGSVVRTLRGSGHLYTLKLSLFIVSRYKDFFFKNGVTLVFYYIVKYIVKYSS